MNELIYYDLKQSPGLTHSLSGQVARKIGRRIVAGHYAPRTQIGDEASLAARYGVSRSVIRDAVKVLVGKGLVSVRRGIGTTVTPRSAWGLLDDDVLAWHQSAPASAEFLIHLTDFRLVTEPLEIRAQIRSQDGLVSVPDRPGIGVEPDRAFLHAYRLE